jgi:hypothetical protein
LSEKHPEKLRQLQDMWWAEAGKYNVLPLDDRFMSRVSETMKVWKDRASYTYYPGTARIPEASAPRTQNRSYNITAEIEIPADGRIEGPICAIGGVMGGWSLYIKDRHLVYCYNYLTKRQYIPSTDGIPTGEKVKLRYEFEKTGKEKLGAGGIGRLYVNDAKVGEGQIPRTMKFRYSLDESFEIERDSGSPVSDEYKAGAQFTGGNIEKIVLDLAGERHIDHEAEARIAMKRQ